MDSTKPEIAHDFSPMLIVYKNGQVERLLGNEILPPSLEPKTNVQSKDVVYSPENGLLARLYIPKTTNQSQKLPLLVYFHGGGFLIESPFSPLYHNHLNALVGEANIIAVSVQYRRAPEHPLPCAYDDSWAALKWVASHVNGAGPEDWLNRYADFERLFFSGDSAGANIAHWMGIRHGKENLEGVYVKGIVLCHPYFWGKEPLANEKTNVNMQAWIEKLWGKEFDLEHEKGEPEANMREWIERIWRLAYPDTEGCDDLWFNPVVDPNLARLGCNRVLVFVAEKDLLCGRGWYYYEKLKESGWGGDVEIIETKEEDHIFHLFKPNCENSVAMIKKIASFYND